MKYRVTIGLFIAVLLLAYMALTSSGKHGATNSIGLDAGQRAPAFASADQFGQEESNETLKGANGTVLLFYRSADWWPFCKAQLVQLQNAKQRFEKQGIKLAAISYDSRAILKDFADRHKIDFPLLADPHSRIIGGFNVLDAEATGKNKGMAHPGFFYINSGGVIREKYFESNATDRFTPNNVIGKLFPELTEEVTQTVDAPHLRLTLEQSDRDVVPGSRVSLIAEIELPAETHVYAPGVKGYRPIQLALHDVSGIEFAPVSYPSSMDLYLEAIQEHVPVYEGKFRIIQDVTVIFSPASDLVRSLVSTGKTVSISGELKYQACDKKVCYPPASVPVTWSLKVFPLDLKRSPDDIRHK
jgi:peroxiredoxin